MKIMKISSTKNQISKFIIIEHGYLKPSAPNNMLSDKT